VGLSSYRELKVWQRSMELVEEVYRLAQSWPDRERFGLISQAQRAAVSIPANISEGYGRIHRGEYVHHLSISNGSLCELETLMLISQRLGYGEPKGIDRAWEMCQEIGKMLYALITSLKARPEDGA
jgi:four helix bundle protein